MTRFMVQFADVSTVMVLAAIMVVFFASTLGIVIVKATNDFVCHWVRSEWHSQRVLSFCLCLDLCFVASIGSSAEARRCDAFVNVIGVNLGHA